MFLGESVTIPLFLHKMKKESAFWYGFVLIFYGFLF